MKLAKWLFYVPGLWLVGHLTLLVIKADRVVVETEFGRYRTYFFTAYAALFLIIGAGTMLGKLFGKLPLREVTWNKIIPPAILGLILVTFSLAIALFLSSFVKAMS